MRPTPKNRKQIRQGSQDGNSLRSGTVLWSAKSLNNRANTDREPCEYCARKKKEAAVAVTFETEETMSWLKLEGEIDISNATELKEIVGQA
jgi:hypothetical protein